uniref:SOCS box domain-containing protein n=1 Tax=Steinernema glaseri TaxID=37863 RepID=A0A1I8A003_9BILA
MDSPDTDKAVRPVNRFRKILYTEGELDNSDLSLPPSPENPHPFDPEKHPLPPTHAVSLAAYVNHLPTLQNLVDLGVNLLEVDTSTKLGRHLVRMDWDRDVMPKLQWLRNTVGIKPQEMGSYLTRNPFFLIQDLKDLQTRVNYLQTKTFHKKEITKICLENRYWLNTDVKTIDARLGWMQEQFHMRGKEVRALVVKEPRVIQYGLGPLQRITMLLNKELQFTPYQLKLMLMRDPRLWMTDPREILRSYKYLTGKMGISHDQLVKFPLALRCLLSTIKMRHEFLVRLNRAQYVAGVPDCISLPLFLHQSDQVFAEKAGRCELHVYDEFVRRR